MKKIFPLEIEEFRVRQGLYASLTGKTYGAFLIPFKNYVFTVIVDNGEESGWEHVSISLKNKIPRWIDMCHFKDLFWEDEETVIQFHPPRSQYVNNHNTCLHMWKKCGIDHELPPRICV